MYIMIANLALYFIVARSQLSVVTSSLIVVLGSFTLGAIVRGIILSGHTGVPILANIFNLSALLQVALQLAVAAYIFRKLREDEDSYLGFMGWSAIGFVGIFFVIPYIIGRLIGPI